MEASVPFIFQFPPAKNFRPILAWLCLGRLEGDWSEVSAKKIDAWNQQKIRKAERTKPKHQLLSYKDNSKENSKMIAWKDREGYMEVP